MPSVIHPHHDQRPQRFAWAPGSYIAECSHCGKRFLGDKRALLCAPCAYNDEGHTKLRDALGRFLTFHSGHVHLPEVASLVVQGREAMGD